MTLFLYLKRLVSLPNVPLLIALLLLLASAFVKPVKLSKPVFTLQIGFDISQSMNVEDAFLEQQPVTRLRYAKHMASTLLKQLPCGSSVGWSVFTGRRTLTLITPLEVCEHYSGLLASLAEIDGTMRWSNGSSIGKGVHQIMRAASEFAKPANVVLITDGQEAPPLEQGQRGVPNTDKFEINGLLVGVGGDTPVPIPKSDAQGNPIGYWTAQQVVQKPPSDYSSIGEEFSRRDDERLLALARFTQLHYLKLDSEKALVSKIMQSELGQHKDTMTDIRWIPGAIALLALLVKFIPDFMHFPLLRKIKNRGRSERGRPITNNI